MGVETNGGAYRLDGSLRNPNGSRSPYPQKSIKVAAIAATFQKNAGNVSDTAKKLKCTTTWIYHHLKKSAMLRQAREDAMDLALDLAESKLMESIKKGDIVAVKFFLETQGKRRGYTRRQEVTGMNGAPIEVTNARSAFIAELAEIGTRLRVVAGRDLGALPAGGAGPPAEAAD